MRYELAFCSFDYDFERKWSSLQRVNLPGAGSSVILSDPLASVADWWLCSVFYRVSPFLAWGDFHALPFRSLYYP